MSCSSENTPTFRPNISPLSLGSNLKVEAVRSSETFSSFRTTPSYDPEQRILFNKKMFKIIHDLMENSVEYLNQKEGIEIKIGIFQVDKPRHGYLMVHHTRNKVVISIPKCCNDMLLM
jgi:hypothetical protein